MLLKDFKMLLIYEGSAIQTMYFLKVVIMTQTLNVTNQILTKLKWKIQNAIEAQ